MMSPDLASPAVARAVRHLRARYAALVACTGVAVVGTLLAQAPERRPARVPEAARASNQWEDYGGGPDSSKFVDLAQITPKNVAGLKVAWTYPVGDNNVYQFNPIVAGTTMYVLAKNQSLVALDATTGRKLWIHAGLRGIARRGINYWESPDGRERRLIFQINNNLQAIDAAHRQVDPDVRHERAGRSARGPRPRSGDWSAACSRARRARSSRTCCCSAPPPARATCRRRATCAPTTSSPAGSSWAFHTMPQPGEFGYETWPKDAWKYVGGANTWGEISIDARRGIAYFPTGSPTYDYYGADRIGSNLFGELPDRARRAHRQAPVALPGRAPRSVGLRPHGGAAAHHGEARRARRSTPSPRPASTGSNTYASKNRQ